MAPALTTTSLRRAGHCAFAPSGGLDSDGAAAFERIRSTNVSVRILRSDGARPNRGRRGPPSAGSPGARWSVRIRRPPGAGRCSREGKRGRPHGRRRRNAVGDLMLGPHHGDLDGSIGASIWVAPLEALCSEEIWLDAFPVPSLAPQVGPAVEVARMTVDPNDTVDRAAATHHPPGHPWRRGAAT